jgi:hypothetical protein
MLGAVVSAQDEFRGFLRDLVSPAMRSAGLSGSAGRYYLPSPSCFALVGFQKSEWSTGSAVTFTVNLKVVSREVWNSPGKIGAGFRRRLPQAPATRSRNGRRGSAASCQAGKITGGGCGRASSWSRWLLR